jgi:hypothetical protein
MNNTLRFGLSTHADTFGNLAIYVPEKVYENTFESNLLKANLVRLRDFKPLRSPLPAAIKIAKNDGGYALTVGEETIGTSQPTVRTRLIGAVGNIVTGLCASTAKTPECDPRLSAMLRITHVRQPNNNINPSIQFRLPSDLYLGAHNLETIGTEAMLATAQKLEYGRADEPIIQPKFQVEPLRGLVRCTLKQSPPLGMETVSPVYEDNQCKSYSEFKLHERGVLSPEDQYVCLVGAVAVASADRPF